MIDYVIVGAGIAGLYAGFLLSKSNPNILILESSYRLGGRINTLYLDDENYLEMGAGGIIDTQKYMSKLIEEIQFTDRVSGGGGSKFLIDTKTVPVNNTINAFIPTIYQIKDLIDIKKTDFYDIMNTLNEKIKDPVFLDNALPYNLSALLEKYYGREKSEQLMYQFGYHSDFRDQNAVDALNMFQKEFSPSAQFKRVQGGMSQIISKLAQEIQENGGVIRLNTKCINIEENTDYYNCILDNGEKISARHIIMAIPKNQLLQIPFFSKINNLHSVINKPLLRIYAIFPLENNKVWFDDMKGVYTTQTLMNQLIPYNKQKGILMIYCDGKNAETWKYLSDKGILKKELMYQLLKLFSDRDIPEPTDTYVSYHDAATHVWKPQVDSHQLYSEIMQPFFDKKIYIIGESYSLNQQWCEGAVQTAHELVNNILANN